MKLDVQTVSKALAGAAVGAAAYVLQAGGVDLAEVTWWAEGIVWIGAGYGIVWAAPANKAA